MTYNFSTSNYARTGSDWIFQWKEFMKTLGWAIVFSSDGYSSFTNNDVLTTYKTGPGGLGNPRAWFVIESPALGGAQFCFQRSNLTTAQNGNIFWRITYSITGFDSGSPNLTTVPTANISPFTNEPDQRTVFGTGTDGYPGFIKLFNSQADQVYRCSFMADDAAPYGWYWFGNNIYDIAPRTGLANLFVYDPLIAGSYLNSLDEDPYIIYIDGSQSVGTSNFFVTAPNSVSITSFYKRGTPQEEAVSLTGYPLSCFGLSGFTIALVPFGIPQNIFNQNDDLFPLLWARGGSQGYPNGYKGQSTFIKMCGTQRESYDRLSILSIGDTVVIGQITLPWNGDELIV